MNTFLAIDALGDSPSETCTYYNITAKSLRNDAITLTSHYFFSSNPKASIKEIYSIFMYMHLHTFTLHGDENNTSRPNHLTLLQNWLANVFS